MKSFTATGRISKAKLYWVAPVVLAMAASLAMPIIGATAAAIASISLMVLALVMTGLSFGALSPLSIIVAISALYAVAPGIGILTESQEQLIEPQIYFGSALPLSLLYLATVLALYGLQQRPRMDATGLVALLPSRRRMVYVAICSLCGSLTYLYSISQDVGLTVAAFDRGEQQFALGTRTSVLAMLAASGSLYGLGMWTLARRYGQDYPWPTKLLLLLALCVFAYSSVYLLGDRRIFLSTVIGVLAVTKFSRQMTVVLLLLALPAYIMFAAYSGLRGVPTDQWAMRFDALEIKSVVDPSRGEFGGWARIAQDVLSKPYAEIADATVLKAPLSVVPSFLYPDRPLAPSLWYVHTYDPATAMRGGAWAFSLVVESFMNFWVFGPIVLGYFVSMAIARFEGNAMRCMLMVFVLAFSFRADLVSIIQQGGWMLLFMGSYYAVSRGVRFR